jgi:hypothetical protein
MENNIIPQLVKCPQCTLKNANAFMGSITTEGYFIIKRGAFREYANKNFYHQSSDVMVMAEEYTILCECGYALQVDHGIIKNAFLGTYLNG